MDKKEAAQEIMQIVRGELASARSAAEGHQSWRKINDAMIKLRRIASILDYDREPSKPVNHI
ncbi:hypothetical protein LB533_15190 [Mesorhizobium sp. BR1-1-13]|uniref:hypothetical protein n=1 Tax=Mesorhizobium sp. BR1-1-13 TaxID=2876656 RepID=UPI001CD0A80B|nr:hypothetical protein [Mesorhizobium sp. BR1-1-13]MBZ9942438.1 hypothetical protein [Mesorhizobium sp. BR1-1-13]